MLKTGVYFTYCGHQKIPIKQMLFQPLKVSMIYCLNYNNYFGFSMKKVTYFSVLKNVTHLKEVISFFNGSCCPCRLFFPFAIGHVAGRGHLTLSVLLFPGFMWYFSLSALLSWLSCIKLLPQEAGMCQPVSLAV